MKLGKSRIHLLILLFALSSLLVHFPPVESATVDTWTASSTTNVGSTQVEYVSMSSFSNCVSVGAS